VNSAKACVIPSKHNKNRRRNIALSLFFLLNYKKGFIIKTIYII